mmetsp:Transcript_13683/g.25476  ORF Transcript_13683/g.25476 Transcript_13683/m.25476 type:complete len:322 (+) Transcript_13683:134-1099(+)|eukprot:CAMPEP_0114413972 /NCGR_PEP_ID=MMETSP0103-20121206/1142_1 /TAXON_ID=37642 ORGANISM="Paraphysomonas imperforata, Strain PA2" /NCGR_SAMPLE_ID=MMETSP0103 /ASSEMBLY_ACC=CAM_ASM_000201 /LENGTH=321 /DNA_ID=CAMNT_0001582087 /DNA_START=66 /DNA_END=1031 /DNA_ORIENTATION=-
MYTSQVPNDNASKEEWQAWIQAHSNTTYKGDDDFGLSRIARCLGDVQMEALRVYWEGAAKEGEEGDVEAAIKLYRRSFKMWPALDSVTHGGLPRGVREQAVAAGCTEGLLGLIEVPAARATRVHCARSLLSLEDITEVMSLQKQIASNESTLNNNPQNKTHHCKVATFMNNPPTFHMATQLPQVIGKMLGFAMRAWETDQWCGSADSPGPLAEVPGGVPSLSIRVVEHWEYEVGGGLPDDYHYDTDSVLTLVALLSEASDFEGGTFRTYECDNTQLEHCLDQGDVICFLSHKYHNIVPLTKGVRKSLVMELWQGGVGHEGR